MDWKDHHRLVPHTSNAFVLALDGPAASGKSTVGLAAAQQLGFMYLDTGLLYRALTWLALRHECDLTDAEAVSALAEATELSVRPASVDDGRQVDVLANGEDVSNELKRPEVDGNVSKVSAYPRVRQVLRAAQRDAIASPGTILAGRDIGTVVVPEADLKVWMTASAEERARRRSDQTGEPFESVLAAMVARDKQDSTRATAPMVAAEDAVLVDTTGYEESEVVERLVALVRERQGVRA